MKDVRRGATLACALLMLAGPGARAAPSREGAGAIDAVQAALESKLRLVGLLLAQSPAAARIPRSDHAQAKRLLAEARAQFAQAEAASGAGRAPDAIALLDAALRQIVAASALVPDAGQQAALQRRRNAALRESMRSYQLLHQNLQSRAARQGQGAAAPGAMEPIAQLVAQAEAQAAGGDLQHANESLGQAGQAMAGLLAAMLTPEPLVVALHFATPADEFGHELARNQGYEELIPIALAQFNAAPATAALAQGHLARSRALRASAQQQARGGAHATAISTIQQATDELQRALRSIGVVMPASPEVP